MRLAFNLRPFLAVAAFAMGATLAMAQSSGAGAATAAKDVSKKTVGAADLQKLMQQIDSQRAQMIADHDALAKQLRDASEEQRKAIMDKMQEQKKSFEAAQSALHKQIREEQRRQRQNNAPGKR